MFYYLGVDLGGGSNTWAVALKEEEKVLFVEKALSLKGENPEPCSFEEIFEFARKHSVLVSAIDAPLSYSLTLKKGLRSADLALKGLLPKEYRNWVLSYHALMGIPLRGLLFAQKLSPYCGAIIETHPRASFYFLLPEEKKYLSYKYKKSSLDEGEIEYLKFLFKEFFSLKLLSSHFHKADLLDAILCALTAYLYLKMPEKLLFLPKKEKDLTGYGPFVIIEPSFSLKNKKKN
ncbi:MAG: DUF429 domain-containing protein [Caldimicrobium sp.]